MKTKLKPVVLRKVVEKRVLMNVEEASKFLGIPADWLEKMKNEPNKDWVVDGETWNASHFEVVDPIEDDWNVVRRLSLLLPETL